MNIKLERPLLFFDLETTGLDVAKDKIVEICMLKVFPDGTEEEKVMRLNPECPIPAECSAIHGIFDIDVKDAPTFPQVADEIADFFDNCDIAGYNSNKFDIPLLVEEFLRIGKSFDMRNRHIIDVQQIYHKMEPRNLTAAYKLYCQKDLRDAHSAAADTRATFEVLDAQVARYQNVEYEDKSGNLSVPVTENVKDLSNFSRNGRAVDFAAHIVFNDRDEEVFNFGKHKGRSVEEVFRTERAYYDWMMKSDFPLYTKEIITKIKNRIF